MKKNHLRTFTSITVIILLVSFFHYIGWLHRLEDAVRRSIISLSRPIYTWSTRLDTHSTAQFRTHEELETAYGDLLRERDTMLIDVTKLTLLADENKILREQLNFLNTTPYQHVGGTVSRVVGKDIDSISNTIIIDRGAQDGVAVNNPVIVQGGILIGKVARVEDTMSIVRLINDNQSKIAATILNKDHSIGLVEGGFGISVRLNFVPQNETVQVGDMIVTSGLETDIPRGLLIGTVESVEKEAYEPFQKAVLAPVANLEKILDVSIITSLK